MVVTFSEVGIAVDERQALLRSILADPEDDLPRLVFADWLEENGEEAYAEYIRVEVEWSRMSGGTYPEYHRLNRDQQRVWHRRRQTENREPSPQSHVPNLLCWYERGFVQTVVTEADEWFIHGDVIVASEPVYELVIEWNPELFATEMRVLHVRANQQVRILSTTSFDNEWLIELTRSTHFLNLRELIVRYRNYETRWQGGFAGFEALADASICRNLHALSFSSIALPDDAFELLAKSPFLTQLRELRFSYVNVAARVAKAIAESANFRHLEVLKLPGIPSGSARSVIEDAGVEHLAGSRWLYALHTLDLSGNDLTNAALIRIAESPVFNKLRILNLAGNCMSPSGLRAFLASPSLTHLEKLTISICKVREVWDCRDFPSLKGLPSLKKLTISWAYKEYPGPLGLLDCPAFVDLRSLTLRGTHDWDRPSQPVPEFGTWIRFNLKTLILKMPEITDDMVRALAEVPWERLAELDLTGCWISQEDVSVLADSKHFTGLRYLAFSSRIGNDGVVAIARSDAFPSLRHLYIANCEIDDGALDAILSSRCFQQLDSLNINGNRLSDDACLRVRAMYASNPLFQ